MKISHFYSRRSLQRRPSLIGGRSQVHGRKLNGALIVTTTVIAVVFAFAVSIFLWHNFTTAAGTSGRTKPSPLIHQATAGRANKSQSFVTDPVCGMVVEPSRVGGKLKLNGKEYYFCSVTCLKYFASANLPGKMPGQ